MNPLAIINNSTIATSARIGPFTNIYNSTICSGAQIHAFSEVGGAVIGACSVISTHSYVCPGVTIGENCFIAHGVMFTNDKFIDTPEFEGPKGHPFKKRETVVGNRVRIGSGAVILPVTIGDDAIIGAGAVVTRDVPAGTTWMGVPADHYRIHKPHCEPLPNPVIPDGIPGAPLNVIEA